jgi:hypothetical protein
MFCRSVSSRLSNAVSVARFSTNLKSSIPVINNVDYYTPSPMCLVQHPYDLDGYKPDGFVPKVTRDLFAVVDFSGTQYKVVDVRVAFFAFILVHTLMFTKYIVFMFYRVMLL